MESTGASFDEESSSSASESSTDDVPVLVSLQASRSCGRDWEQLVTLAGKGGKTPFQAYRSRKKDGMSEQDVFDLFVAYNCHLAKRPFCVDTNRGVELTCSCLKIMDSEDDDEETGEIGYPYQAVASWQMDFAALDKPSQQCQIIAMIRSSLRGPLNRSRETA